MDNFVIGTIQENIKTLQSDLNRISSDIPTKFNHLTDVSGKWTIDSSGDIIPEYDNTVSLGSSSKRIKSIYVSDGSIYIVKKNQSDLTTIKFHIDGNDELKITKETYNSIVDLENNNPAKTEPGIVVGGGGSGGSGGSGVQDLNDLDSVIISSPVSHQFLKYDGKDWKNVTISTDNINEGTTNLYYTVDRVDARVDARIALKSLNDLDSVIISSPVSHQFLKYDGNDWKNVTISTDNINEGTTNLYYTVDRVDARVDARIALKSLNDLASVIISSPVSHQFLKYDGNDWKNVTISTDNINEGTTNLYYTVDRVDARVDARIALKSLNDLDSVIISSPVSHQFLKYDGNDWVNSDITRDDITDFPHITATTDKVAIGNNAGNDSQGQGSTAIGTSAAQIQQGIESVAIGYLAGQRNQEANSIAIGASAAWKTQGIESVAIGNRAGETDQSNYAVAIGAKSGLTSQGSKTVAIGYTAGETDQGSYAVAIGASAAWKNQGEYTVAIGYTAGYNDQKMEAIAIGYSAGTSFQGEYTVAIGSGAGTSGQGNYAVSLGQGAGSNNQGKYSIAIGSLAGESAQGDYSIAIGHLASVDNTGYKNYIILNASYDENAVTNQLNPEHDDAFYVKPIRSSPNTNKLLYDPDTGEITHQPDAAEGVPTPPPTTTLLDSNIENIEFTNATISGTDVEINGNIIGTTIGAGVNVSPTNGISTTQTSHVDLNMRPEFEWTSQFTLEFYFKMPVADGGTQNFDNTLFDSFNLTDNGDKDFKTYLSVSRRRGGSGIQFVTYDLNGHNSNFYTETTVAGFDGNWGHVVLTNDSNETTANLQKKLYVNGQEITNVTFGGVAADFAIGPRDKYRIGTDFFDVDNGVENLKIFRVYNRILSDTEVETLYDNRDMPSDVTNYHLVSNNATGTETKWVQIEAAGVPAPLPPPETPADVTNYVVASNNSNGTETKWLNAVPAPLPPPETPSDVTNYVVASNNSNGTETKWLNAVPAPPTTLLAGAIESIDFTEATISGTDVEINGNIIGTTIGAGVVEVSEENGISTTTDSYVDLNMSTGFGWPSNFTLEFYFKMPVADGTQNANILFDSFNLNDNGSLDFKTYLSVGRRGYTNGIQFLTTETSGYSYFYTETTVAGFDGNWGHIVLTNDSNETTANLQKKLYVNGQRFTNGVTLDGSLTLVDFATGPRDKYRIGRDAYGSDTGVENIKLFRVYNRILSDTEVETLYDNRDMPSAITNYHLVSNNATGTETKWVQFPHITTTTDKVAIGYKASQGNTTGYKNYIVLNAQTTELNPDNNDALYVKPIRPSPNTNKLLYNPDTGEITYQPDDEGVPAPVYSIISPTLPTTLLDNNIESFDFAKATISGTDVKIDGNTVGTTSGTGVQVSPTLGIKTTESSYADLNMRDEFAWTSDFTLEFYFMMPAADGTQQNNNYLFTTFDVIAATGDADMGDMLFVSRRHATNGIQFYTAGANFADNNLLYTESTVAGFDGNWGHIVLTHESSQPAASQKQLYVNGVRFTDGVQIQGSIVNFTAGPRDKYRVGRDTSNGDNGVENLKIFRVYSGILNAQEVATLYESYAITNYHLVSNNATGTETKWVQFPHITTTTDKVAIGLSSGTTSQGNNSIAIGASSGNDNQGSESVALGWHAGRTSQGSSSIAIGVGAAPSNQGGESVAIGASAGHTSQDQRAIAIGRYAGYSNQGAYSIAIGEQASLQNTGNFKNYIILNAKYEENAATNALNPSHSNAFYVKPIRPSLNNYKLLYNPDSGEITYQEDTAADSGNTPSPTHIGQILIATGSNNWGLSDITLGATHIGTADEDEESWGYSDNSVIIRARAPRPAGGKIAVDTHGNNIAIGHNAGAYDGQDGASIAIGAYAGENAQGRHSVAIGNSAAPWNQGGDSVAIGTYAGSSYSPGPGDYPRPDAPEDDWDNHGGVFIGARAGHQRSGYRSVAIGYHAGHTIGDQAVCIGGRGVYDYGQQGDKSIAIGYSALCHQYPNENSQIAIGHSAIAHGNGSIVIGSGAQNAIEGVQDVHNSIVIGQNAVGNGHDTITLGDTNIIALYIPGLQGGASVGDILRYDGEKITLASINPTGDPHFSDTAYIVGTKNDSNQGQLEFHIDGVERFRIESSGALGVGYGLYKGLPGALLVSQGDDAGPEWTVTQMMEPVFNSVTAGTLTATGEVHTGGLIAAGGTISGAFTVTGTLTATHSHTNSITTDYITVDQKIYSGDVSVDGEIYFPVGDGGAGPEFTLNIKGFNDGSAFNETNGHLALGYNHPTSGFNEVLGVWYNVNVNPKQYVWSNYTINAFDFNSHSDDRIKSNEKPITQGVPVIEQLQPKIYDKHQNHRVPADKEDNDLTGVDYVTESGFVAQDVDKIEELKHLVRYNVSQDLYSLNYTGIIPYLVQSIKELNARIKVLESK